MKTFLTFVIVVITLASAHSQQLNIPKNKSFEITANDIDATISNRNNSVTYAFHSLGKNAEGNNVLECRMVKTVIIDTRTKQTLINTDSVRNVNFNSTEELFPLALLNKPFTITVSPKGKVISVEGFQTSLKEALDKWNLNPDIRKMLLDNADNNNISQLESLFYQFPHKPMKSLSAWQDKDSGVKFKIIGNKGNIVTLTTSDRTSNARFDIDASTGLIQKSYAKTTFTKMKDGLGVERDVTGEFITTKAISNKATKVNSDTAWINMAVRLGNWSGEALRTGGEYDSVKVKKAFNEFEGRFKNDPYFVVNKLNLTQQMARNNSYAAYDNMLMEVPNQYLKGQDSHLFNKLGTALDKQGASAAYDVSKYVYDKESFTDWVQQSFSQGFLFTEDFPQRKEIERKAHELLNLFVADKNPVYQSKTKPLYLWVNAKDNKNNETVLIKTAAEFIKMNDEQMQEGNGRRYALLMYNLLIEANRNAEADSLLAKTIIRLEKYTADSLNKSRYASQNLLAHAYYLKYQSVVKKDSIGGMQYLALAAQYSPKDNKEKAYTSFYDRAFLKSKESYRDEFIDKLLNGGDEKQALKIFAIQINANPESLNEMQNLYKKRFPKGDFKAFFTEQVIGTWRMAPGFKVKNINGKEHSLADFKDKWLVLDFWGTWCGPCKEELPDVNKFYAELSEGKYGNSNFLSIACYDTEEKVKTFISYNKYTIPVAMSDNKVESNYKIMGYPSKIIISPDGHMLNVAFGGDWKGFLKNLNEIYASK